jgi:flavin reductase (DIM6/NTAB) family NADH-FMN oxidoreductase RutF
MPITPDEYKSVMRCWATGVTIVTTSGPDGPHGMTANSFTGVSLDPPLILICVSRQTRTHEHLLESGVFGVHLLHSGQEELSNRCAGLLGEHGNEIADLPHVTGPLGVPVLDDCLAALVCRVHATYDGGDHTIFLGAIHAARLREGAPLVYLNRGYHRIG